MVHSDFMKVLVVMQVGARRKCRRASNIAQNNPDNANGEACTKNQTDTFIKIKYLKIVLTTIFFTNFKL